MRTSLMLLAAALALAGAGPSTRAAELSNGLVVPIPVVCGVTRHTRSSGCRTCLVQGVACPPNTGCTAALKVDCSDGFAIDDKNATSVLAPLTLQITGKGANSSAVLSVTGDGSPTGAFPATLVTDDQFGTDTYNGLCVPGL